MSSSAIFLSYASQDADAARRLCDALRAAGLEVWFDQSELRGGDAWDASIRKQIKECALFVPIVSNNTDARPEGYFRLEWTLAVDRSHLMADDQPFFVPVILEDTPEATARVPERFRERQWMRLGSNMNGDSSMAAFAARVAILIAKLVDGRGSPGKNAPRSAPNNEFVASATPVLPVAPETAQRDSGAKVSSTAREDADKHSGLVSHAAGSSRDNETNGVENPAPTTPPTRQRTRIFAATVAVAILALSAAIWFSLDRSRKSAFIAESIIKIDALTRGTKFIDAFKLAQGLERAGGADLLTDQVRNGYSRPVNVESKPPGASIAIRPFGDIEKDPPWIELGKAPLQKLRVPRGALEWRATLAGHQAERQVGYAEADKQISFALWPPGAAEATMVPVGGGVFAWGGMSGIEIARSVKLAPYLIDREELTHREFARFVQAGGYTREEFW